jgi:hypothetical protein
VEKMKEPGKICFQAAGHVIAPRPTVRTCQDVVAVIANNIEIPAV